MTSSSAVPKGRRALFLEIGGPNSIHNFASSVARAQSFLGSSLLEAVNRLDNVSPLTLPEDPFDEHMGHDSPRSDLHSFRFPDEQTPLVKHASGNSTSPQTIFNSINTLMGIAMLLLPFGVRISGWVLGSTMLVMSALVTNITAKMLGRIIAKHPHVSSYGDLAHLWGGARAQMVVTGIFTLDLLGATFSLILLFSDSFAIIFPTVAPAWFKLMVVGLLFVTLFLPLAVLSLLSVFGIVCTSSLILIMMACGFIAPTSPGSLLHPATTSWWPQSFTGVLFSLGIFMAPWGGHAVFPEFYRDMRHRSKYAFCCNIAFAITYHLDLLIAIVGYLMFGAACQDSFIKNIMSLPQYPDPIKSVVCVIMGLLPISKIPLVVKPIITVYENFFNLQSPSTYKNGRRLWRVAPLVLVARIVFVVVLYFVSTTINNFGKIIAFLGSAICFVICVSCPLTFYLSVFRDELSPLRQRLLQLAIVVSLLGAAAGTYGTFVYEA